MNDVIKLLPDTVANQIAAGEVIQRPASVVKELVENAIDAGAKHIKVVVIDAGKTSLQVIDDGCGMTETDARLAFERHATSKITSATDLFTLQTMGFRGEALPSIAAVAQVELRTRRSDKEIGTCLQIEGGKVIDQQPAACPIGCNFSVRNLFFNIPARRKFLKSNQTEMTNILTEFERIALSHPATDFTLYNEDAIVMQLPAGNLRQRIVNIFGKRLDTHLLPVEVDTPLVRISGFVGTPESARKKVPTQYFFANGRFMRHPYFAKAILTAYERLIPEGEQIPYFIRLEVAPDRLDVNIHPQKTEIKFQDDATLWQILLAAVREALGKFNAIPTLDFDTENKPEIPTFQATDEADIHQPKIHIDNTFNPFDEPEDEPFALPGTEASLAATHSTGIPEKVSSATRGGHHSTDGGGVAIGWEEAYQTALAPTGDGGEEQSAYSLQSFSEDFEAPENRPLTIDSVTQYQGRYIIAVTDEGLLITHQGRAHQRLLYNTYLAQLREHKGVSQGLLFPQLLEVAPSAAAVLDPLLPELADVGFDISPLGGGSFSILGIPAGTEGLDPIKLLQAIIAEAGEGGQAATQSTHHHIAATLARQAAMPIGQALTNDEMKEMLLQLQEAAEGHYTPDGKIIQYTLTADRLEQLFK